MNYSSAFSNKNIPKDYYPFGMVMPNRSFSAGTYRFGFNSQEKDDEICGAGNTNTAEFWEYSTRLGRRWNLDPKPNPSNSAYSCFENSPVYITDHNGDTTYRFNNKGAFQGMGDLDAKGIIGSLGEYTTVKDSKGKESQIWNSSHSFSFNDPTIDKEQLNCLSMGEIGITLAGDGNINWIMKNSGVKPMDFLTRWDYAFWESGGGRMDFNFNYTLQMQGLNAYNGNVTQFDQMGGFILFGDNKTAYNLNDAGQFLWGHGMKRLGFEYSSATIGAQTFARTKEKSWDTDADQKAIREGYFYSNKIRVYYPGPFEGLPEYGWATPSRGR